jgi:undecaprenyl-diphosphatase
MAKGIERARLLALAGGLLVPFALLLQQVVGDGPLTRLDARVATWAHDRVLDHPVLEGTMHVLSFLASGLLLTVLLDLALVWMLVRRDRRRALFLPVVGLGGSALNSLVKVAVGRDRPRFDVPITTISGKSFPSGHSMSAMACYGALLVVVLPLLAPVTRRWVAGVIGLVVLGVGASRIGLGVHFLSDVLGGFLLGAAWLAVVVAAFDVARPAPDP